MPYNHTWRNIVKFLSMFVVLLVYDKFSFTLFCWMYCFDLPSLICGKIQVGWKEMVVCPPKCWVNCQLLKEMVMTVWMLCCDISVKVMWIKMINTCMTLHIYSIMEIHRKHRSFVLGSILKVRFILCSPSKLQSSVGHISNSSLSTLPSSKFVPNAFVLYMTFFSLFGSPTFWIV